jgi:hypothetical protein
LELEEEMEEVNRSEELSDFSERASRCLFIALLIS